MMNGSTADGPSDSLHIGGYFSSLPKKKDKEKIKESESESEPN